MIVDCRTNPKHSGYLVIDIELDMPIQDVVYADDKKGLIVIDSSKYNEKTVTIGNVKYTAQMVKEFHISGVNIKIIKSPETDKYDYNTGIALYDPT